MFGNATCFVLASETRPGYSKPCPHTAASLVQEMRIRKGWPSGACFVEWWTPCANFAVLVDDEADGEWWTFAASGNDGLTFLLHDGPLS